MTLTNNPAKSSISYSITVTPSGGDENPPLVISVLSVETVCGSASTVLTEPSLAPLVHASEAGTTVEQSATFDTSNSACPIQIVSTDSAGFAITNTGGDYIVTLA